MKPEQMSTLVPISQFPEGMLAVTISIATCKEDHYRWAKGVLVKHQYLLF